MADSTASEITVARVDGQVRVVVRLPEMLDALSPNDRSRLIENAMWRASMLVADTCDAFRAGVTLPKTVRVAA